VAGDGDQPPLRDMESCPRIDAVVRPRYDYAPPESGTMRSFLTLAGGPREARTAALLDPARKRSGLSRGLKFCHLFSISPQ
jgi:hypothetical protein